MKGLVRDCSHPEANLANSVTQDVDAKFKDLVTSEYDISTALHHTCVLSCEKRDYEPDPEVLADIRMLGVAADCYSLVAYKIAHILGVHFRSGEWGQNNKGSRCGSVIITCVFRVLNVPFLVLQHVFLLLTNVIAIMLMTVIR